MVVRSEEIVERLDDIGGQKSDPEEYEIEAEEEEPEEESEEEPEEEEEEPEEEEGEPEEEEEEPVEEEEEPGEGDGEDAAGEDEVEQEEEDEGDGGSNEDQYTSESSSDSGEEGTEVKINVNINYSEDGERRRNHGTRKSHKSKKTKKHKSKKKEKSSVAIATAGVESLGVGFQHQPTLYPADDFNPEEDAKTLRKAMKGFGTDEKAITGIVGYRCNYQRQEIETAFKTLYGKDLIQDLKSELKGNFEDLVLALFMEPNKYDAYCLHKAMAGVGTNESILMEILLPKSNDHIKKVVAAYKESYGRELEKDIISETTGHFRRLLVSACQGNREEWTDEQIKWSYTYGTEELIDWELAREEAHKLYRAGEKKFGTDESAFLEVMGLRSDNQLCATFDEYQKIAGKDIMKTVKKEMSGDLQEGFKALVMIARGYTTFYAYKLHKALSGFGTNDSTLIRIIVSRAEIDLQDIKGEYKVCYGKTLHEAVAKETSGDFKKLLLILIGD